MSSFSQDKVYEDSSKSLTPKEPRRGKNFYFYSFKTNEVQFIPVVYNKRNIAVFERDTCTSCIDIFEDGFPGTTEEFQNFQRSIEELLSSTITNNTSLSPSLLINHAKASGAAKFITPIYISLDDKYPFTNKSSARKAICPPEKPGKNIDEEEIRERKIKIINLLPTYEIKMITQKDTMPSFYAFPKTRKISAKRSYDTMKSDDRKFHRKKCFKRAKDIQDAEEVVHHQTVPKTAPNESEYNQEESVMEFNPTTIVNTLEGNMSEKFNVEVLIGTKTISSKPSLKYLETENLLTPESRNFFVYPSIVRSTCEHNKPSNSPEGGDEPQTEVQNVKCNCKKAGTCCHCSVFRHKRDDRKKPPKSRTLCEHCKFLPSSQKKLSRSPALNKPDDPGSSPTSSFQKKIQNEPSRSPPVSLVTHEIGDRGEEETPCGCDSNDPNEVPQIDLIEFKPEQKVQEQRSACPEMCLNTEIGKNVDSEEPDSKSDSPCSCPCRALMKMVGSCRSDNNPEKKESSSCVSKPNSNLKKNGRIASRTMKRSSKRSKKPPEPSNDHTCNICELIKDLQVCPNQGISGENDITTKPTSGEVKIQKGGIGIVCTSQVAGTKICGGVVDKSGKRNRIEIRIRYPPIRAKPKEPKNVCTNTECPGNVINLVDNVGSTTQQKIHVKMTSRHIKRTRSDSSVLFDSIRKDPDICRNPQCVQYGSSANIKDNKCSRRKDVVSQPSHKNQTKKTIVCDNLVCIESHKKPKTGDNDTPDNLADCLNSPKDVCENPKCIVVNPVQTVKYDSNCVCKESRSCRKLGSNQDRSAVTKPKTCTFKEDEIKDVETRNPCEGYGKDVQCIFKRKKMCGSSSQNDYSTSGEDSSETHTENCSKSSCLKSDPPSAFVSAIECRTKESCFKEKIMEDIRSQIKTPSKKEDCKKNLQKGSLQKYTPTKVPPTKSPNAAKSTCSKGKIYREKISFRLDNLDENILSHAFDSFWFSKRLL